MVVPKGRPWRVLLSGELAERAEIAINDISAELVETSFKEAESGKDSSLSSGHAGIALFFAYLHLSRPNAGYDEIAMTFLNHAIDSTVKLAVSSGLFSGFSGVAWTIEHFIRYIFTPDGAEDPGQEIAATLESRLSSPWHGEYDLISGLVGFGVYALERLPRPGGLACLEHTITHLAEASEQRQEGVSWYTPPERMGPSLREITPKGHYNLGVAHGVSGVIGLLGQACAIGISLSIARPLLKGAVNWLLSQRLPPNTQSIFPHSFALDIEPSSTRLSWCYGDLGIAAVLLAAALASAEPEWESLALFIAREAAARPIERSGVIDAGLCHGAAGNAHLFNRLYQASSDEVLRVASCTWFEKALALRKPGEGIGGYRAWLLNRNNELGWTDDPGFLTGSAGIGLALLAATTTVRPSWDRILLTATT